MEMHPHDTLYFDNVDDDDDMTTRSWDMGGIVVGVDNDDDDLLLDGAHRHWHRLRSESKDADVGVESVDGSVLRCRLLSRSPLPEEDSHKKRTCPEAPPPLVAPHSPTSVVDLLTSAAKLMDHGAAANNHRGRKVVLDALPSPLPFYRRSNGSISSTSPSLCPTENSATSSLSSPTSPPVVSSLFAPSHWGFRPFQPPASPSSRSSRLSEEWLQDEDDASVASSVMSSDTTAHSFVSALHEDDFARQQLDLKGFEEEGESSLDVASFVTGRMDSEVSSSPFVAASHLWNDKRQDKWRQELSPSSAAAAVEDCSDIPTCGRCGMWEAAAADYLSYHTKATNRKASWNDSPARTLFAREEEEEEEDEVRSDVDESLSSLESCRDDPLVGSLMGNDDEEEDDDENDSLVAPSVSVLEEAQAVDRAVEFVEEMARVAAEFAKVASRAAAAAEAEVSSPLVLEEQDEEEFISTTSSSGCEEFMSAASTMEKEEEKSRKKDLDQQDAHHSPAHKSSCLTRRQAERDGCGGGGGMSVCELAVEMATGTTFMMELAVIIACVTVSLVAVSTVTGMYTMLLVAEEEWKNAASNETKTTTRSTKKKQQQQAMTTTARETLYNTPQ